MRIAPNPSNFVWWVFLAIIVGLSLRTCEAKADGLHVLDLDHFDMEYYKLDSWDDDYATYSQPGGPGEAWKDGAATNFNLTLASYGDYKLYMDNRVHMEETNRQVRLVGWQWEAGVRLDRFDIFWHHHSQHLLDAAAPQHFPLENYYGVRVTFYDRGK